MSFKKILTLTDAALVNAGTGVADGDETDIGQLGDFVFELIGVKGSGTNLTVWIQDSFDDGVTWNDVALGVDPTITPGSTFTLISANGTEVLMPLRPMGGLIRTARTSTGNGWSYIVKAACNPIG